ncbi:MAG: hypothetical protein QOE27_1906, partial [Solirubrobacteraceae bacterium]|nr:hypothetical protein [Solirubrobacteraceae bacterium]
AREPAVEATPEVAPSPSLVPRPAPQLERQAA